MSEGSSVMTAKPRDWKYNVLSGPSDPCLLVTLIKPLDLSEPLLLQMGLEEFNALPAHFL